MSYHEAKSILTLDKKGLPSFQKRYDDLLLIYLFLSRKLKCCLLYTSYVAQALNNTLTPWAELPDGNNEMSQIALDKSGDGQLYMLKVLRNGSQVMILMTESDGTVRFAMFNGTQYVSSPLILHRDGCLLYTSNIKTTF